MLARIILRHVEAAGQARFAFINIDLDRTESLREPLHLLMEAARQLAYQSGELAGCWSVLKTQWSEKLRRPVEAGFHLPRVRGDLLRQFRDNLRPQERALLVTLDSFAEDQRSSPDALWRLLNDLQGLYPKMRVVMSGRDLPTAFTVKPLPSGRARCIHRRGVHGRARCPRRRCRPRHRRAGGRQPALPPPRCPGRGAGSAVRHRLGGSRTSLPGTLYRHVLSSIQDHDVRRLALASLVLRRLSVALLEHVLAGPCSVEIRSQEHADRIFSDVRRHLLLAKVAADGSLQHTPDVRRTVLEWGPPPGC